MYPASPETFCERCGASAPTRNAFFIRHIGLLVLFIHSHVRGRMCRRCLDSAFLVNTGITAVFGWWGIISFFVTCIALPVNIIQYLMALSLPRVLDPHAAGPSVDAPYGALAPAEPRAKSKTPLLVAGLILAPIALCCVGMIGVGAYAGVKSSALSAVGEACNGAPIASAAPYVPGGTGRVVVFEQTGRAVTVSYDLLPDAYTTGMAEDAQLVLCLEPEATTLIETCPYLTSAGMASVERYRSSRRARLVVARTGVELASEELTGTDPQACAAEASFYGSGSLRFEGGHVGPSELAAFVDRTAR